MTCAVSLPRPCVTAATAASRLRGVTGAMAVEILVGHTPAATAIAALAQVHSEHAALYSGIEPVD